MDEKKKNTDKDDSRTDESEKKKKNDQGQKIQIIESPQSFGLVGTVVAPGAVAPIPKPARINPETYDTAEFDELLKSIKEKNLVAFNRFFGDKRITDITDANGSGFAAAVIDTGVYNHDDLKDSIADRLNCTLTSGGITDLQGHGTHIAGIIAGKTGIAPEAKIVSLKITELNSSQAWWSSIARALKAVMKYNEEVDQKERSGPKISVVNLSFNGFDNLKPAQEKDMEKHVIYELIRELYDQEYSRCSLRR
jgi:subtilisin family serine protease